MDQALASRIRLAAFVRRRTLKRVAADAGLAYDRALKLLGGFRRGRPEEISALVRAAGLDDGTP